MKTDSIFYRLFKDYPIIFFELIGLPIEEADIYKFDSYEVKESSFRIDGLFIPTETNHPLYFAEVQFRYDAKIYSRVFSEIFIYLNQNDPGQDWRTVVIYDTRNHEPRQLTPYQELLNSAKVTRIYLNELPQENFTTFNMRLIELIISTQEIAIEKGKRLLADAQQVEDEDDKIDIMELVETVLAYKFSNLSRQELVKMFSLDEFKQSRLYQDIQQEILQDGTEELIKVVSPDEFKQSRLYQDIRQESREELREEVREEVLEESKLETATALAEKGLTVEEIAEIVKLDVEKVQQAVQKYQSS